MPENSREDILVMTMFIVTKDDVRACADELGMSKEQITDEVIELVKEKVSQGLGEWQESIKGMVKEAIRCPLGLACAPSCAWQEVCGCKSPREVE
ncbi:hypothetical protein ACFLTR_02700 [Chloroflexota bacterium]